MLFETHIMASASFTSLPIWVPKVGFSRVERKASPWLLPYKRFADHTHSGPHTVFSHIFSLEAS